MKTKKFFALMLVAVLAVSCLFAQSINEIKHGDMYGKTVILHSNDVHGAIEGYAKIAALRDSFEAREASVILVESLILAQNERWRHGLGMQVGRGAAMHPVAKGCATREEPAPGSRISAGNGV